MTWIFSQRVHLPNHRLYGDNAKTATFTVAIINFPDITTQLNAVSKKWPQFHFFEKTPALLTLQTRRDYVTNLSVNQSPPDRCNQHRNLSNLTSTIFHLFARDTVFLAFHCHRRIGQIIIFSRILDCNVSRILRSSLWHLRVVLFPK